MISTPPERRRHYFLLLTAAEMEFLINRDQLCASLFLDQIDAWPGTGSALSGTMQFREQTVPIFNFDNVLQRCFQCTIESLVKFALVSDVSEFSREFQTAYRRHMLRAHPELSPDYVALIVGSQAQIIQVPLMEINLIPAGLRQKQAARGVLGCRFSASGRIQYFLDIETVVRNEVLQG